MFVAVYPQCCMKARASSGVIDCIASPIASCRSSIVRRPSLRSRDLIFEMAISIGLKSGEYGGGHPAFCQARPGLFRIGVHGACHDRTSFSFSCQKQLDICDLYIIIIVSDKGVKQELGNLHVPRMIAGRPSAPEEAGRSAPSAREQRRGPILGRGRWVHDSSGGSRVSQAEHDIARAAYRIRAPSAGEHRRPAGQRVRRPTVCP